jgi:hypothetical protein
MRFAPFTNTALGPVEKWGDEWGFTVEPPIGEPRWQGGFTTREQARQLRREMVPSLRGTGALAEMRFWRGGAE